jgi:hypothetical protein
VPIGSSFSEVEVVGVVEVEVVVVQSNPIPKFSNLSLPIQILHSNPDPGSRSSPPTPDPVPRPSTPKPAHPQVK